MAAGLCTVAAFVLGAQALSVWFFATSAHADITEALSERNRFPNEGELFLSRVYFEGNRALDDDDILPRISLTPRAWSVWGRPHRFERESIRDDIQRIENVYKKAGYYNARVDDVEITLRPDGRSVDVTFKIDEGKPVTVTSRVRIVYPGAASDEVAALDKLNPMQKGDVFSVELFGAAKETLRTNLRSRGFYAADVTPESWVRPEQYAADVTLTIYAGPRVHFGSAIIRGNKSVGKSIIRREFDWKEGTWFNESQVENTIADLYALNLFRVVRIRPRYPNAATDPMPVDVLVSEGDPQSLRFGVGYGTEDRMRAQARYQHFNILGGAQRLDVLLRYSFLLKNAEATLIQPYLFSKHNTLSLTAEYREQEVVDAFTYERYALTPRVIRKISRFWQSSIGYQLEYNRAYAVQTGIPLANRNSADPGYLSGAIFDVERNSVDSLLAPTHGNVTRISWLQAGKLLHGDFDFYKYTVESHHFFHPFRRLVIGVRAKGGIAKAYPDSRVPIYEKFYSGGTDSIRGYRQDRLGPQIGGLTLVEGSVEVRRRMFQQLFIAGFVDAGMVGLRPYSWEPNQVRWGGGPGLRVRTLLGLIRVDVGIPLQPRVGEPTWRFHLSIGQAF